MSSQHTAGSETDRTCSSEETVSILRRDGVFSPGGMQLLSCFLPAKVLRGKALHFLIMTLWVCSGNALSNLYSRSTPLLGSKSTVKPKVLKELLSS
jgi:hypothetical protein